MFDIAWSELAIIAVVAVVVVPPKDLPRMMRLAGQWIGRARAMADQFKRSFEDMARQAELEEMRAEVMKTYNDKSLADIQRETEIMLGNIPPDAPADAMPNIRSPEVAAAAAAHATTMPPELTGEKMPTEPAQPAPMAPPAPAAQPNSSEVENA